MRSSATRTSGFRPLLAACLLALSSGMMPGALAQVTGAVSAQAPAQQATHFISFRSRYAHSYGHTFAMFGRLNAKGEMVDREVAGLHPATDSPVPWMIGHVVPVPSEVGPSDGDLEEEYVSARFDIPLTEAEYNKVVAYIRDLQARSPLWHATLYNCNAFVADIARSMGLKTPASTLLYPENFITSLRELNSGGRSAAVATTPERIRN